jgi:hypothetical protein
MTEAEWASRSDPERLLEWIAGRASERKLILFGCACCYRQWEIIPDGSCKSAVEIAERFADELCEPTDLRKAREAVRSAHPHLFWYQDSVTHAEAASYFAAFDLAAAGEFAAEHARQFRDCPGSLLALLKGSEVAGLIATAISRQNAMTEAEYEEEGAKQCAILRDIFGNPFRPVAFDPRWRTSDVLGLARAIYEDRAFDRMPVLADALMDAGCADEQVLGHCRSDGPHVRGCWVVDLVLGKA